MSKIILEKAVKDLREVQKGMNTNRIFPDTELEKMMKVVEAKAKSIYKLTNNRIELFYEYTNSSLFSPPSVYITISFGKNGDIKEVNIEKKKCYRKIERLQIINYKEFTKDEIKKIQHC